MVISEVRIDVAARMEGAVETLGVEIGEAVEAGRLLARIGAESVHHELTSERAALTAAEAEERRARLRVELAAHTHRRQAALTDILSKEQIEESRFELESARLEAEAASARVRQAEARLAALEERATRSRIAAPITGVVAAVYVEPGAVVTPGAPIVRLIGAGGRIRFAVPPGRAGSIERGAAFRVRVEELGLETTATVTHLAPEIDPDSQMVFAEAALSADRPPGERLPVGAVVRVGPAQRPGYCAEDS